MKRVLAPLIVVLLVIAFFVGQQVWAAMMRRPPLTTHLKLAVLPALPWARLGTDGVALRLPWGFHARRSDEARATPARVHLPFGYGDYRTQHPLGGGTTHQPLQVDVIVVREDLDSLGHWFFNSAASFIIGGAAPDNTDTLPGDITLQHFARPAGDGTVLRAIVIVDVQRHLRLEVVDLLERFDEAALRAFAVDVAATIVVAAPLASPS